MEEGYTKERLLVLRRLTRAISDFLREQVKGYLSALAPLLRPKSTLGEYVQGSAKEAFGGSEKAFQDLQSIYEQVAGSKPFNLPTELKPPLQMVSSTLEMTPVEYSYAAKTERQNKNVLVTSPLKWALTYSGFSPRRLEQLLADPNRADEEAGRFALHYAVLHVVVSKQATVSRILEALRFLISSGRSPEFGELPITYISSSVSTLRPSDDVIIESTEISGRDVFEEIVDINAIRNLRDPLRDQLMDLIKSSGANT